MLVKVQLFASLRESLGNEIEIDVPEPVTARSLLSRFVELHPQFREAAANLNVAVNQEYSQEDLEILPGHEVAIFPPVSGG